MISLANFTQTPRDYQERAIQRALAAPPGSKLLLSAPTGTGKGSIQLALMERLLHRGRPTVISTPSLEVMRGYLERCGATPEDLSCSAAKLAKMGEIIHVYTPIRLRNRLRKGTVDIPDVIISDEAHHAVGKNIQGGGIADLCPNATWIGFTATPYRGTPKETHQLREMWGEPHHVLKIPEAVEIGAWALPKWEVRAIVDDDICGIRAGDLDADEVSLDRITDLAAMIHKEIDVSTPTCVTLPSVAAAMALHTQMETLGMPSVVVVGETTPVERASAYRRVAGGGTLLISVRVLGEGVDMPWLRRWVDASPTLSPVSFLQKLGRITRPGEVQPEYWGTNRNLERHGYLLQGCLPREEIAKAQAAFGGPSERHARAGLIKGVRRLKPIDLPIAGGVTGTMWALWTPAKEGGPGYERCIMLDPTSERMISAIREIYPQAETARQRWGKWTLSPLEGEELKKAGFRISKLYGECSENQLRWWKSVAESYGLDGGVVPTKRQFYALPVLTNLRETFGDQPLPELEHTKKKKEEETKPLSDPLWDGYFTVVDGHDHRTYRVRTQGKMERFCPGKMILSKLFGPDNTNDYSGAAFIGEDGACRVWRRYSENNEEIQRDWEIIAGNQKSAGQAYALQSGSCYVCSRRLTTPESIEAGIGPVCREKVQ